MKKLLRQIRRSQVSVFNCRLELQGETSYQSRSHKSGPWGKIILILVVQDSLITLKLSDVCLPVYIWLCSYLSVYLPVCLFIYIHLSVSLSISLVSLSLPYVCHFLSLTLPLYIRVCLSVCPSITFHSLAFPLCRSVCLSVC